MFFKRKSPTPSSGHEASAAVIKTIPELFYGGSDPEVYHQSGKPATTLARGRVSNSEPNQNKKKLIGILFLILFLTVAGFGGWYVVTKYFPPSPSTPVVPQTAAPVVVQTAPIATSTPIIEPTTTASLSTSTSPIITTTTTVSFKQESNFEFPPIIQIDAADLDADGLTDAEEEIFGTDPSMFDTDKDGYYDGQEVFNLYNPKGTAPVRLVDSGLIRDYVSPSAKYRVYYPATWQLGTVDVLGNQVLISAENGDYVEVRVSPKQNGEDFTGWFSRLASGERITELQTSVNLFSVSYYKRKDDLVAYFDTPNVVYVLIYHPKTSAPLVYHHVVQVMEQSFRLPGVVGPITAVEQTPSESLSAVSSTTPRVSTTSQ